MFRGHKICEDDQILDGTKGSLTERSPLHSNKRIRRNSLVSSGELEINRVTWIEGRPSAHSTVSTTVRFEGVEEYQASVATDTHADENSINRVKRSLPFAVGDVFLRKKKRFSVRHELL